MKLSKIIHVNHLRHTSSEAVLSLYGCSIYANSVPDLASKSDLGTTLQGDYIIVVYLFF